MDQVRAQPFGSTAPLLHQAVLANLITGLNYVIRENLYMTNEAADSTAAPAGTSGPTPTPDHGPRLMPTLFGDCVNSNCDRPYGHKKPCSNASDTVPLAEVPATLPTNLQSKVERDLRARLDRMAEAAEATAELLSRVQRGRDAAQQEIERLRSRVHEAVNEVQRRYARMQSEHEGWLALKQEAMARHHAQMAVEGKPPGAGISSYDLAIVAEILAERDEARSALSALRDQVDQAVADWRGDYASMVEITDRLRTLVTDQSPPIAPDDETHDPRPVPHAPGRFGEPQKVNLITDQSPAAPPVTWTDATKVAEGVLLAQEAGRAALAEREGKWFHKQLDTGMLAVADGYTQNQEFSVLLEDEDSSPLTTSDVVEVWKERAYAENERRYAAEYARDAALREANAAKVESSFWQSALTAMADFNGASERLLALADQWETPGAPLFWPEGAHRLRALLSPASDTQTDTGGGES